MLAKHFGLSAYEARHVVPAWEVDDLLDGLAQDANDQKKLMEGLG